LVIGAGLYKEWINSPSGISIENLPTYYGNISYSIKKENKECNINISGDLKIPSGKIILKNIYDRNAHSGVFINNKKTTDIVDNDIIIRDFPCEIKIKY
jgi:hypothetical protein